MAIWLGEDSFDEGSGRGCCQARSGMGVGAALEGLGVATANEGLNYTLECSVKCIKEFNKLPVVLVNRDGDFDGKCNEFNKLGAIYQNKNKNKLGAYKCLGVQRMFSGNECEHK